MKRHAVGCIVPAASMAAGIALALGPARAEVPSVYGVWLTQEQSAHVELWSCEAQGRGPVCGRLVEL